MQSLQKLTCILALLLQLTACGGGGGGGDDDKGGNTSPPVPPPPTNTTCSNNNTLPCASLLTGDNSFSIGSVNSANDVLDYARYSPANSGNVSITLNNYGSNDLDLELRSSADLVLGNSISTTSPEEIIVHSVTAGSIYYIVVIGFETGGLDASYDLDISLDTSSPPPPPPAVSMSFSITDSCNDGFFTRFKFYDVDNNLVWPNSSTHYTTPGLGITSTKELACVSGAKICYGAALQADGGGVYWGIGLNGDKSCTNCCYTCTLGSSVGKNLSC